MIEREAFLILNAVGLTNFRIRELIDGFGSAKEVLSVSSENLMSQAGLPEDAALRIVNFDKEKFLEEELKLIKQFDVEILTFQDEDYPERLKTIVDAPIILYRRGTLTHLEAMSIAIVGSRRASVYGFNMAEKFAVQLAELGITIVSGLAKGIDTAAHQGALKAKGPTIAVLGCGLSQIYPPQNKKLFDSIAQTGCIFSEFPMTMPPLAYNFPRRNRIISGLSLGVLVIEAFKQSGALITSRLAGEQGREVFALPGNVDTPQSEGTHHLIQQGAKLVTCVEDILEELEPQLQSYLAKNVQKTSEPQASLALPDLPEEESKVYQQLTRDVIHIDLLTDRLQIPLSQLSPILLSLQLKNLIKEVPGKYFCKR